jgi:hypothetical protein
MQKNDQKAEVDLTHNRFGLLWPFGSDSAIWPFRPTDFRLNDMFWPFEISATFVRLNLFSANCSTIAQNFGKKSEKLPTLGQDNQDTILNLVSNYPKDLRTPSLGVITNESTQLKLINLFFSVNQSIEGICCCRLSSVVIRIGKKG